MRCLGGSTRRLRGVSANRQAPDRAGLSEEQASSGASHPVPVASGQARPRTLADANALAKQLQQDSISARELGGRVKPVADDAFDLIASIRSRSRCAPRPHWWSRRRPRATVLSTAAKLISIGRGPAHGCRRARLRRRPPVPTAALPFAPLRADVIAVQELAVAAERLNQLPGGNATGVDRQRQDPLQDRRHLIDCICRLRRGVRVIAIIDHVRPQLSDTRTS